MIAYKIRQIAATFKKIRYLTYLNSTRKNLGKYKIIPLPKKVSHKKSTLPNGWQSKVLRH